jgi:hypothetical protein
MNYLAKTIKGVGILASSTTESAHTTAVCRDEEGEEYVDAVDAVLHPDAHEDGGLACRDRQLLERQRRWVLACAVFMKFFPGQRTPHSRYLTYSTQLQCYYGLDEDIGQKSVDGPVRSVENQLPCDNV